MFSLLTRKENAHDNCIWCVAWNNLKTKNEEEKNQHCKVLEDSKDYIASGGLDGTIKLWSLEDDCLNLKHNLQENFPGVVSLDFNFNMIVSSSLDSSLCLWDTKGNKLDTLEIGDVGVWTTCFYPDGNYVISGSLGDNVNIYSIKTKKKERTLDTKGHFPLSIACSPDGKYVASGSVDGSVVIFDMNSGKLTHTLLIHAKPIRSLAFLADSKSLLTASDDFYIKLYDLRQSTISNTFSGHTSSVYSVSMAQNNKYFVSGGADCSVKVWELSSNSCMHTFNEHSKCVWGAKFNLEGNRIVSCAEDCNINIYDCSLLM